MSVVCCKVTDEKIEIASDSITVRAFTQSKSDNIKMAKLANVNQIIIGSVGFAEEIVLMQMFCETHQPKKADMDSFLEFMSEFSTWKNEKTDNYSIENSYIFVYKNKAFAIEGYLIQEIVKYEAIGAGMDFALAAMFLGHGVREAIEVASELSIYCETPVIYYSVELTAH